jgi:hypothetical protein
LTPGLRHINLGQLKTVSNTVLGPSIEGHGLLTDTNTRYGKETNSTILSVRSSKSKKNISFCQEERSGMYQDHSSEAIEQTFIKQAPVDAFHIYFHSNRQKNKGKNHHLAKDQDTNGCCFVSSSQASTTLVGW